MPSLFNFTDEKTIGVYDPNRGLRMFDPQVADRRAGAKRTADRVVGL